MAPDSGRDPGPDELPDDVMVLAVRLAAQLAALAALAAHLRVQSEGLDVPQEVRARLEEITTELAGHPVDASGSAPAVIGMTRAFLRQAADLVDDPGRQGGWDHVDEALLQGIGRLSGAIAGAIETAAGGLDGLAERLTADGARFLDVGTGTGWLAITMALTFPRLAIVGRDLADVPLTLARANVVAAGLDTRVELRLGDVTELEVADA